MNARDSQLFDEHTAYSFCSWPGISKHHSEMFSPDSPYSPELDVAKRIFRLSGRPSSWYPDLKAEAFTTDTREVHEHDFDDRPMKRHSTQRNFKPDSAGKDSTQVFAGSFSPSAPPDPSKLLLLRFRSLPPELTLKIADEIVREAVNSLYTGCLACRWQNWSKCICRHWQKSFCVLASLDSTSTVGEHVRRRGKELARAWGYSPVDAFGPYAAGYRFTGSVIGGMRMGDFLFVDERLTALPEPSGEEDELVAIKEAEPSRAVDLDADATVHTTDVASSTREPARVHWASNKGLRLAGLQPSINRGGLLELHKPQINSLRSTKTLSATISAAFNDFKCFNMSLSGLWPEADSGPGPRPVVTAQGTTKRFSKSFNKPGTKSVFNVMTSGAEKFRRHSFKSVNSRASLLNSKRTSQKSSARTSEERISEESPGMIALEKSVYS